MPFPSGLTSDTPLLFRPTVKDGTVREHETFDCYEPLPAAGLIRTP
jgi:hypothetical protein